MASETITQNDLREILSRTVGSIPSEYKKLLWTNPSPTSAFSAQTVSLDLSNYDDVEVEFMCWNTEQQEMASVTVEIGASGRMVSPLAVCAFRKFSVTSTSVAFENAQAYPNYGNWSLGTQNNSCIPYRIYGIKYERVAPPQIDNTLEVASGTVDHSGFNAVTVAGASSSYKTISFGKTFSKIPQVVVQEHNNSLNNYGAIGISVSYVTTTGFNLYAHGVPQTTLSGMSYDWIAMTQIGE